MFDQAAAHMSKRFFKLQQKWSEELNCETWTTWLSNRFFHKNGSLLFGRNTQNIAEHMFFAESIV